MNALDAAPALPSTPVATYVRMSTDDQVASPLLQMEALQRYAGLHAMTIVHSYADEGQSGLVIAGRRGLQALLADVLRGDPGYVALLIHDVSRWGRFQDVDEGAYYEFLCRRAGIRVIYCAEHFVNDGAPLSQLLKSIKRCMAAEYSRELGIKVFSAQCRLAAQGFKQGGAAKFGLRRIAIAPDGAGARTLVRGERKPRPTDRVVFGLGDSGQLALVRRIFRLYIEGMPQRTIARLLNAEGIAAVDGRAWSDWLVKGGLCCELYCGTYVYNVGSTKMYTPRIVNAPCDRLRTEGALAPVIDLAEFEQAAAVRRLRNGEDHEAVLVQIRSLYALHGKVTEALLRSAADMPGYRRLQRMFGGVHGACVAAGLVEPRPQRSRPRPDLSALVAALRDRVCMLANQAGARVIDLQKQSGLLHVDGCAVRVAVSALVLRADGSDRWRVRLRWANASDVIVCGLLASDGARIDRYVLVQCAHHQGAALYFCARNYARNRPLVFPDLEAIFGLPAP